MRVINISRMGQLPDEQNSGILGDIGTDLQMAGARPSNRRLLLEILWHALSAVKGMKHSPNAWLERAKTP